MKANGFDGGTDHDDQPAATMDSDNVPASGTYDSGSLTCATLIERVVGFMERYDESWNG